MCWQLSVVSRLEAAPTKNKTGMTSGCGITLKHRVIEQEVIVPGVYRMSVEYRNKPVWPGQFFMLKVGEGSDPLLRRPFSVHEMDTAKSPPRLKFLYQVVGRGTAMMSRLNSGEEVDLLGPLGNGFSLIPDRVEALMVAGGIGAAPFLELAKTISREYPYCNMLAFIGGKTATDILTVEDLAPLGIRVAAVTEDGSLGTRGLVTEALERYLAKPGPEKRQIFACGPLGMMHKTAQLAGQYGVSCQVSLDKAMACGVGACRGCVTPVKDTATAQGFRYQAICRDGPVFDAETLFITESH